MLTVNDVISIINNNFADNTALEARFKDEKKKMANWESVYYSTSLHTKGACPKFTSLVGAGEVEPPFYFGDKYQYLFDNFLFTKHPREQLVTRNWRYSQYRPLTQAPLIRIIEVVLGAIFQDSQFTLELENTDDDDFIKGENFEGLDGVKYDMISYFVHMIAMSIFEDPNGYSIRMPAKAWYEITEAKVPVAISYVRTIDIIWPPDGNDFIFYDREKKYIYWVSRVAILRFRKSTDGTRWELEDNRGYYAHMLGYLPITKGGGVWNTEGFLNSYLFKAVPIANEFISSFSAEQIVDKEASHPFIQIAAMDCPTCEGEGRIQKKGAECATCPGGYEYTLGECPTCRGRKQVSFNPADRLEAPADQMDKDLIKIIAPPIEVNTYHRNKNKDLMTDLLDALGLLKVQESQSGVAKAIDQEKLYQFISMVNNNFFDNHIFNAVRDITAYRNVRANGFGVLAPTAGAFKITKASQFQIKTADDLLAEVESAGTAKVPSIIRRELVVEYMDKRFGGDEVLLQKTKIISQLDKLFIYSPDEKAVMKGSGEVSQEDLHYSINLPLVIDEIGRERGNQFLFSEIETIEPIIDEKIAAIPLPVVTSPTETVIV